MLNFKLKSKGEYIIVDNFKTILPKLTLTNKIELIMDTLFWSNTVVNNVHLGNVDIVNANDLKQFTNDIKELISSQNKQQQTKYIKENLATNKDHNLVVFPIGKFTVQGEAFEGIQSLLNKEESLRLFLSDFIDELHSYNLLAVGLVGQTNLTSKFITELPFDIFIVDEVSQKLDEILNLSYNPLFVKSADSYIYYTDVSDTYPKAKQITEQNVSEYLTKNKTIDEKYLDDILLSIFRLIKQIYKENLKAEPKINKPKPILKPAKPTLVKEQVKQERTVVNKQVVTETKVSAPANADDELASFLSDIPYIKPLDKSAEEDDYEDYESETIIDYFHDTGLLTSSGGRKVQQPQTTTTIKEEKPTSKFEHSQAVYTYPEQLDFVSYIKDFKKYLKDFGYKTEDRTIRHLFSSLAASKLLVLNEDKTETNANFLTLFSNFIGSHICFKDVSDNNSFNYYINENESSVLNCFKNALKNPNTIHLMVFNNVDLASVDKLYKPLLDYSMYPKVNKRLNSKDDNYSIIPDNVWFVIMPKKNLIPAYSLMEASIYLDLKFNLGKQVSNPNENYLKMSYQVFKDLLLDYEEEYYLQEINWKKLDEVENHLNAFNLNIFNNKMVREIEKYMTVYLMLLNDELEAIDSIFASKILPLAYSFNVANKRVNEETLFDCLQRLFSLDNLIYTHNYNKAYNGNSNLK